MPKRTSWTKPEIDLCLSLRDEEKKTWVEIGAILGRSKTACQAKWDYMHSGMQRRKYSKTVKVLSKSIAPCAQQMERDARLNAGARDLTAWFFGDPPLGYSALETRESDEHRHRISHDYSSAAAHKAAVAFAGQAAE